ncbi:MAG: hypothetical protein K2I92_09120 [Muribaculaceae bacterium]|nr:hypothetical protein [Muribaculaceae bacterium]
MEKNIQSDNKSFSLPRFQALMKSDFLINKGTYIKLAATVIGCFIALAILISIFAMNDINSFIKLKGSTMTDLNLESLIQSRRYSYSSILLTLCFWVISIALTIFGSLTFSSLSSKKQRISTFMLPASLSEKYILRMLVYFVGGAITLLVGCLLAILIAQFTFAGSAFHDIFKDWNHIWEGESFYVTMLGSIAVILGEAIYTLGSSLWPKLSWIKTWLVVMVIQWIGGVFLISGLFSGIDFAYLVRFFDSGEVLSWTLASIMTITIIVCWYLAWRRFRNTQIIQRFMTK